MPETHLIGILCDLVNDHINNDGGMSTLGLDLDIISKRARKIKRCERFINRLEKRLLPPLRPSDFIVRGSSYTKDLHGTMDVDSEPGAIGCISDTVSVHVALRPGHISKEPR